MDQELLYLHSLKQLYGLLQNGSSVMLDEKSKLVLKNLLDTAIANVDNSHSKGKYSMELTEYGNDQGFKEPRIQKPCSGKQNLSVGMGGSEDMDMLYQVHQRSKPSAEPSTSATRKCTKSSALSVDGKGKLRSSVTFSKSPGISEDSEDSGSTFHDCISSGSESTNNFLPYLYEQDSIKKRHRKAEEVRKFQPSSGQYESDASEEYHHHQYETQRRNHGKSPARESDEYSSSGDDSQEFSVDSGDEGEVYYYASHSCNSCSGNSSQSSYSGDDESEEGYYSPSYKPVIKSPQQPKGFSVGRSRSMRPRRATPSIRKNAGKMIGQWKKLKHKIPSIFHPHHRHGHVHNPKHADGEYDDLGSLDNMKAYRRLPLQRIEKYENALTRGGDRKVVQKSVNAMQVLFNHVNRNERSRLPAEKFKPLKGSTSGNTGAKRNWLKILQCQKKSKKLGLGHRRR